MYDRYLLNNESHGKGTKIHFFLAVQEQEGASNEARRTPIQNAQK